MAKKDTNTTSIGFEEAIWRAADKLRGNLDAAEYKSVVLGLALEIRNAPASYANFAWMQHMVREYRILY